MINVLNIKCKENEKCSLETTGKMSRRESKYVKRWVYTIDQIQQIRYLKKKQKNKKKSNKLK